MPVSKRKGGGGCSDRIWRRKCYTPPPTPSPPPVSPPRQRRKKQKKVFPAFFTASAGEEQQQQSLSRDRTRKTLSLSLGFLSYHISLFQGWLESARHNNNSAAAANLVNLAAYAGYKKVFVLGKWTLVSCCSIRSLLLLLLYMITCPVTPKIKRRGKGGPFFLLPHMIYWSMSIFHEQAWVTLLLQRSRNSQEETKKVRVNS